MDMSTTIHFIFLPYLIDDFTKQLGLPLSVTVTARMAWRINEIMARCSKNVKNVKKNQDCEFHRIKQIQRQNVTQERHFLRINNNTKNTTQGLGNFL